MARKIGSLLLILLLLVIIMLFIRRRNGPVLAAANVNDERAATKLAAAQVERDTTDAALIDADVAADEAFRILTNKLKEYGVSTEEQVELFRSVGATGIDFAKILALLVQYGPQIMALIKVLFPKS